MNLTNCSDVSLSVFAYFTFCLLPESGEYTLARSSGEDAGSERPDISREHSSGVGTWTDEASRVSYSWKGDENRTRERSKYNERWGMACSLHPL